MSRVSVNSLAVHPTGLYQKEGFKRSGRECTSEVTHPLRTRLSSVPGPRKGTSVLSGDTVLPVFRVPTDNGESQVLVLRTGAGRGRVEKTSTRT